MMYIKIGENTYEVSTKLGVSKKLESFFRRPLIQFMSNLDTATTTELINVVAIATDKVGDAEFLADIDDNWDYSDLYMTVNEIIIRLQFSGPPDVVEAKLAKYPTDEKAKNAIRGLLGMPLTEIQPPEVKYETYTLE